MGSRLSCEFITGSNSTKEEVHMSNHIIRYLRKIVDDRSISQAQRRQKIHEYIQDHVKINREMLELMDAELIGSYGIEYMLNDDYDGLTDLFECLIEMGYNDPMIKLSLGDVYLLGGRKQESIDAFLDAFRMEPELSASAPGELPDVIRESGTLDQQIAYQLERIRTRSGVGDVGQALRDTPALIREHGCAHEALQQQLKRPEIQEAFNQLGVTGMGNLSPGLTVGDEQHVGE